MNGHEENSHNVSNMDGKIYNKNDEIASNGASSNVHVSNQPQQYAYHDKMLICRNCTTPVDYVSYRFGDCGECSSSLLRCTTLTDITGATNPANTISTNKFNVNNINKTGLTYDDRMTKHYEIKTNEKFDEDSSEENNSGSDEEETKSSLEMHPERPDRIKSIYCHLKSKGIVDACVNVAAVEVTTRELSHVHASGHIEKVDESSKCHATRFNSDTYANSNSALAARISAGSCVEVTRKVAKGELSNAIAIVRPPGHHAEEDTVMGFCLYNNVAVAARTAQKECGMKKIMIIDWDVHHGNGTQAIFENDDSVLYLSLHRFDNGQFYPGTGSARSVGSGVGRGYCVNIPWIFGGMGDTEYIAAFTQIVLPIAYEFSPDLVMVSAGFDAARGDPLGGCDITPAGYAHMTHLLKSIAGGKLVIALEGGYNLKSISQSMEAVSKVCLGLPPPKLDTLSPLSYSARQVIADVIEIQSQYWSLLRFQSVYGQRSHNEDNNSKYNCSNVVTSRRENDFHTSGFSTSSESDHDRSMASGARSTSTSSTPGIKVNMSDVDNTRQTSIVDDNRTNTCSHYISTCSYSSSSTNSSSDESNNDNNNILKSVDANSRTPKNNCSSNSRTNDMYKYKEGGKQSSSGNNSRSNTSAGSGVLGWKRPLIASHPSVPLAKKLSIWRSKVPRSGSHRGGF